jgi:deoxyribodipyrimidine photolyase-related protein
VTETTLWLLGDQLNLELDALEDADDVLLIEAYDFADRRPYHTHKLTLVFSAMRHFRDDLRERGHSVTYVEADSFGAGVECYLADNPDATLELMRPASHRAGEGLRDLVESKGGSVRLRENELFWTSPADWRAWADEPADDEPLVADDGTAAQTYRQEHWYRHVRRETGVLVEDGEPVGGEWNYDDHNQETPPADWEPPARPVFEPDALTRETHEWVCDRFDTWGTSSLDSFAWPVTRAEAQAALDDFLTRRLPAFGRYDAHSLLSPAINLGLLNPREPVRAVEAAYDERGVEPGAYDPDAATGDTATTLDAFGETDEAVSGRCSGGGSSSGTSTARPCRSWSRRTN